MTPTLVCRSLYACGLALFLAACSRPGAKHAAAADTAQAAVEAVAVATAPAADAPAPASEEGTPAPVEAAPTGTPHVAFDQASYDHAAGDEFSVTATIYDASGGTLPGETVRYTLDDREVAWMTDITTGKSCKDYVGRDRHISLTGRSGGAIGICGQKPGATTLHADGMANLSASAQIVVH